MAGFRQRVPGAADIAMVEHPAVSLLVDLTEGAGLVHDTCGRRERGTVVIELLPGELRAGGSGPAIECLQIRLSLPVAAKVLGASTEFSGTVVSLEDVWGRDAGRVEDRLRAAATWEERFTIAVRILGRRLESHPSVDPEVAYPWRRMRTGRGRIRVDDLADEVGWSRERLRSRFGSQLGTTPKRAARLVRFDHAAHLLAAGHAPVSVAADSGYVDQSHLHREVKAITGAPPAAVAAAPTTSRGRLLHERREDLPLDDVAHPVSPTGRNRVQKSNFGSGSRGLAESPPPAGEAVITG